MTVENEEDVQVDEEMRAFFTEKVTIEHHKLKGINIYVEGRCVYSNISGYEGEYSISVEDGILHIHHAEDK